jgi:hypothetical protein
MIGIGAFGKKTPFHAGEQVECTQKGTMKMKRLRITTESTQTLIGENGHTFWQNPLINGRMMMDATSIRLRDCQWNTRLI